MLPEAITTKAANAAAKSAGSEIIKPAVPFVVCNAAAMEVNSPTGSISVVTTAKVAKPTAITAGHEFSAAGVLDVSEQIAMIRILEID